MPATPSARRWGLSLLAVLLAHGLAAAWLVRRPAQPPASIGAPAAILIDLAPPAAPADSARPSPPAPAPAPVTPAPAPAPARRTTDATPSTPKPPEQAPVAPRAGPAAAAPPASTAAAEPDADAAAAPPPPATTAGAAVPAGHATGAQRAAEASWQSRLLGHLEGFRRYPMRALRQRHEGVTYLRFSVDRRGAVTAVRLERGSGSAALDAEALEVVRRAQPLPAPPREIEGDPVEVVVPVEFRLRRR